MATPREIFEKDSSKNLRVHAIHKFQNTESGENAEVVATINFDFEAGVTYGSIFIEDTPLALNAIVHYLQAPEDLLKVGRSVETAIGFHGADEAIKSSELSFSGRILAYTGYVFPDEAKAQLVDMAKTKNLSLVIRDGAHLAKRAEMESPMAFISHDSRDKEPFVRELASTLQKMLCTVWYDEFSLVPGQSLRACIEDGLKKCKKCILVLSPNFIGNGGWTKAEFDSVFTREILEQENVIIPVWHGVTKEQVYEYSPRMLDRVAVPSDLGVEQVARRLLQGLNYKVESGSGRD